MDEAQGKQDTNMKKKVEETAQYFLSKIRYLYILDKSTMLRQSIILIKSKNNDRTPCPTYGILGSRT